MRRTKNGEMANTGKPDKGRVYAANVTAHWTTNGLHLAGYQRVYSIFPPNLYFPATTPS